MLKVVTFVKLCTVLPALQFYVTSIKVNTWSIFLAFEGKDTENDLTEASGIFLSEVHIIIYRLHCLRKSLFMGLEHQFYLQIASLDRIQI